MHILCRHPKPYPILIGALTLTLTDGLICKRNLNSFDVPNTVSNLTLTNGSYDKQIPKNKIPTSIKSMVVIIDDYDKTLIGLPDHLERLHIVYNYGQLPKHVTKDRHVPGIPFLNGLPMHFIREPEIAECSKNARICNILLEFFHIFFTFHKKNYFSIFVFVASVNLSICTNKSSFHNYSYKYPLFF